ncbi:TonB-dependent receptor plug domain-containing protein [Candidatus Poribacteria bacterium]
MYGKHTNTILVLLCFGSLMTSLTVRADDAALPKRELLLLQEIPVVTTPAKVEQTMLESPSTITVLTKEDIRRYGITSFSDILRNVPGVDVISASHTDRNIGIRGSSQFVPSTILSFVDGLPAYLDLYGTTPWESLPVSIDEIKKIEIVRGPGSALYGANAFSGIINIVTDPALAAVGVRVATRVDKFGRLSGSIIHGSEAGNLGYKTSAEWNRISGWDDRDTDVGESKKLKGYLKYAIDDRSDIHLTGGVQETEFTFRPLEILEFDPVNDDRTRKYLKLDYDRSNLGCHVFWDRNSSVTEFGPGTGFKFESDTVDTELQHSFRPVNSNFITWGLNHRLNRVDSEVMGGQHSQNLWAGYIQDQIRLSTTLTLTAGLRYDRHPLTGNNLSPRSSIVYSPKFGHAFRASAGRAFQNPPFVYSYVSMDYKTSVPVFPVPISVKLQGNRDLSPEWITSFELGYQGIFGNRFSGGLDIFFNRLHGLTEVTVAETYAKDALFPASPGGVIPAVMSISNTGDAEAQGGEISGELSATRWLAVHANYSYQRIIDSDADERMESAPRHKLNSGLCVKPGQGLLFSVFANYVDGIVWNDKEIDSYIMLNSVVSYRPFGESLDITLSVSNLLNNEHIEHPEGTEVGRSIILRLMYQI